MSQTASSLLRVFGTIGVGLLLLCTVTLAGGAARRAAPPAHLIAGGLDQAIYLQAGTLHPHLRGYQVQALVAATPIHGQVWLLVQLSGPITERWRRQLAGMGTVSNYIPMNTLLMRLNRHGVANVARLPFVRWMGTLPPRFRVSPALWAATANLSVQRARLNTELLVHGFAGARLYASDLHVAGVTVISSSRSTLLGDTLHVRLHWGQVRALASLPTVAWIEPRMRFQRQNDVVRRLVGVNQVWAATGLYGAGQTVAIADTGIDTGVTSTLTADLAGRIAGIQTLGRRGKWDDPEGHGTHVAGILAGSGANSGSDAATHAYSGTVAGMAPEARLFLQSILDSSGDITGIPDNLANLFGPAYAAGARIHNDSWGNIPQDDATGRLTYGAYDTAARDADAFVWTHPDMLIVIAAGNDGVDLHPADGVVDLGSIDTPALAKNVIAVGGSENDRPPFTGQGGTSDYTWNKPIFTNSNNADVVFPKEPIGSSYISGNPDGMMPVSSRGPTSDGRIKPDISAPASNVATVESSKEKPSANWGPVPNRPGYVYDGGTSMAAPVVSGVAALLREYLQRGAPGSSPSAALLKALLLNGAYDMQPGQYGTGPQQEMGPRPNNVEGWGRVDLAAIVTPAAPVHTGWSDQRAGLITNQNTSYTLAITDTSIPLHITLAWSDYPGTLNAARELVNDLDLRVRGADGATAPINGAARADRVNTVETADVLAPLPGIYTITVTGYNVPQGPQPYALALSCGCDGVLMPAGTVLITPTALPTATPLATAVPASATPTPHAVATPTAGPPGRVAVHLGAGHRAVLRRAGVTRSLWTSIQAQQRVNQQRIVARIIIQGQARAPVLLLIDFSTGPLVRLRGILDGHGYLQVDVPSPLPATSTTMVLGVRVIVGTGRASRTYQPTIR